MAITLWSNKYSECSFPVAHICSRNNTDFESVHAKYGVSSCIAIYVFFWSFTSVIEKATLYISHVWSQLELKLWSMAWTWQPKETDFLCEDSKSQLLFGWHIKKQINAVLKVKAYSYFVVLPFQGLEHYLSLS